MAARLTAPRARAPSPVVVTAVAIRGGDTQSGAGLGWIDAIPDAFSGQAFPARGRARDEADEAIHIPNRPDRRAMGQQFALGVCAASEALNLAGLTGADDRTSVAIYVATRTAERDEELDRQIHREKRRGEALNQALMTGLRPTMFLAQLPNLLAGNLAIVLGVRGTSRTFAGEEMAGFNALWCAERDVSSNRVRRALVGGAINGAREDLLRWLRAGGHGTHSPRPEKLVDDPQRGVMAATSAAFLVLEAAGDAEERGVRGLATLHVLARQRGGGAEQDAGFILEAAQQARAICGPDGFWLMSNTHGVAGSAGHIAACTQAGAEAVLLSADLSGSALEVDGPLAVARAVTLLSDPDYFKQLNPSAFLERLPGNGPSNVLVLTHALETGMGALLVRRWQ